MNNLKTNAERLFYACRGGLLPFASLLCRKFTKTFSFECVFFVEKNHNGVHFVRCEALIVNFIFQIFGSKLSHGAICFVSALVGSPTANGSECLFLGAVVDE